MTGDSYHVGTSSVTARLNVANLLDQTYFTNATPYPANGFAYGTFSTPRTFLGSMTIEY